MAARLRQNAFSVGNTVDPAVGYRAFRGREPEINALVEQRGFPMGGNQTAKAEPTKTGAAQPRATPPAKRK